MAQKYNCSISVGVVNQDMNVEVASGIINRADNINAKVDDPYVWGSVTKMTTGTGVLRLIDAGKISYDSKAAPLIDPFLKQMAD